MADTRGVPNPFATLPIEMRQNIAAFLESDIDLCRYRVVCKETYHSVDQDQCSFWRRRFLDVFESPSWKVTSNRITANEKFKDQYQKRKSVLKNGAVFRHGQQSKERRCLEVLRDLIVDAHSDHDGDLEIEAYESKNLAHILRFIDANDLLKYIFKPQSPSRHRSDTRATPNPLMHAIQIVMAPALLSLDVSHAYFSQSVMSFPRSQQLAYGAAYDWPIFTGCHGLDVNMEWVLHVLNFWRYHMVRPEECTLYQAFEELEEDERPQWWSEQIKQGASKVGKHWKGSYAFVDKEELQIIRSGDGDDHMIQDKMNGEVECDAFQDMKLQFVDPTMATWPDAFERHLRSTSSAVSRAKTRAQHRSASPETIAGEKSLSFQFQGEGHDDFEDFLASGWLNPLPPQQGIPGWQRMTMMKYFDDGDGVDEEALWAYEGVVLPGGKMMLGRWWSPNGATGTSMYSGPFILWCVDGSERAMEEDLREQAEVETD